MGTSHLLQEALLDYLQQPFLLFLQAQTPASLPSPLPSFLASSPHSLVSCLAMAASSYSSDYPHTKMEIWQRRLFSFNLVAKCLRLRELGVRVWQPD